MITIGQLTDWILENRKNKVFKGWTRLEIAQSIKRAVEDESIMYFFDTQHEIKGVVLGVKFPEKQVMFISEILTIQPKVMQNFTKIFGLLYPDWTLEAMRHGKHKVYKTKQFIKKFTKIKL